MDTIDNLLKNIVTSNSALLDEQLSHRDAKALKNLTRLIDDSKYITENQAKLVLRLLKENVNTLKEYETDIIKFVDFPVWERQFREIQQVRKIYVDTNTEIPQIIVEFTFSAELHKVFQQFNKTIDGLYTFGPKKSYGAPLTEKNIVELLDRLKNYKFIVSDELKEYYKTIKSWVKSDIEEQYQLTTLAFPNFEKQIINDLGINTSIDQNIINDRSVRYQYFVKNQEKMPENLTELLANRESTKLWIDNAAYPLDELVRSFIDLKRLPMLVVLDTRDTKRCLKDLTFLSESLEKNGIFDGVGVYFRLENDTHGKAFNQLIADKKYNCQLDSQTSVVVVQSGKIPKFLLKLDWKPMSVVSINHQLRHSKTAVYANCCDLVVTYTDSRPIIEVRHPWE